MQMVIFLALLSMSWFVGSFLMTIMNQQLLGISTDTLRGLTEIGDDLAGKIKIVEMLALVIMLLMPAALFSYLAHPRPLYYVGMRKIPKFNLFALSIVWLIVALPFSGLLEHWSSKITFTGDLKKMDDNYTALAKAMLSGSSIQDLLFNIFSISLFPAIIEEYFFRGCLQQILLQWMKNTPYTALIVTAIIFSLFHGQMSGFLPRAFLGLLLGLAYYYTGSLWVSILMHFLNNTLTVVMVYLFNNQFISVDVTKLPPVNIFFGIGSALAVLAVAYLMNTRKELFIPLLADNEDKLNTNKENNTPNE